MRNWLLRGLVFGAAMLAVRLVQGALINTFPTHAALISVVLLIVFAAGVALWALGDGRADATANPDPDRRADLAMTWLVAGLLAGFLSGVVARLIGLFDKALYTGGLLNEVTTFAAFTALLVFLVAVGAVSVGRLLVDKNLAKAPVKHHGLAAAEDRADTDVFAAVGAGAAPADADAAAAAGAVGAPPAAEYYPEEAPTQAAADEETTGVIPPLDEDTTAALRPENDS